MYPLCVDLDGTLVKTDMLFESALALLKKNPLYFFGMVYWFFLGKPTLKRRIAERVTLNYSSLPFDERIVDLVKTARASKRTTILITASDEKIAQGVANHLGLFDEVIATAGQINMKGKVKADLLVGRYGEKKFDYAGDSHVDEIIWKSSLTPIVVNASPSLAQRWRGAKIFPKLSNPWVALFKCLRPHQYIKNILIFVPVLTAHRFLDLDALANSLFGFIAFSLLASAVYVLNDLLDLDSDRHHVSKRRRPFASGALSISTGLKLVPLLILMSAVFAYSLPSSFIHILILYFLTTCFYSFYAKKLVVCDVILLAWLYTLRIIAGGAVTETPISEWLNAFSMFFFLSLAFLKRATDLAKSRDKEMTDHTRGRGYITSDLPVIQMLGTTSGFLAILVYALYINSPDTRLLYPRPDLLWLNCPIMLYGLTRLWLISSRAESVDSDTIVFAAKQISTYVSIGLMLMVMLLAAGRL